MERAIPVGLDIFFTIEGVSKFPTLFNMASNLTFFSAAFLLLACVEVQLLQVQGADPEEIRDFAPPPSGTALDANYFTFTGLSNIIVNQGAFSNVTAANVNTFPALSGLGLSNALIVYPPGSVGVPHSHPRGSETLFIIEGELNVGLIDTLAPVPKLFTQRLMKDDIFVFPRGLVHFQINKNKQETVRAYASFSSTNPGLVSIPRTLFGVNIDIEVLTKSFEVSPDILRQLSAQQP